MNDFKAESQADRDLENRNEAYQSRQEDLETEQIKEKEYEENN